ncbi:hypothetical protein JDV09_09835 [Mycobacterium sp. Y57]|nr:hypothetical protein [Mycolicibacterium xanthum]MBX7432401.1 hypothetical protein [Mycolicibacterium xanthum]
MVLAISFVEAPLKFRAPGVTLQIGLGIGRLVFRALNACEVALAAAVLIGVWAGRAPVAAVVAAVVAAAMLVLQLVAVRPSLSRRSDRVLAGAEGPRSHAHFVYVGFEFVKVLALIIGGIALLSA